MRSKLFVVQRTLLDTGDPMLNEKVQWRAPGSYDALLVSEETGLICLESEDMAQQQFRDDVDINQIVKRFGITNELPIAKEVGQYADFSEVTDFQTALQQLRRGEEAFLELPVVVRDLFGNDPGNMYGWFSRGGDVEELLDAAYGPGEAREGSNPVPTPPAPADEA
jgi:hypothetical protein